MSKRAQQGRINVIMQTLAWLSFMVLGVLFFGDQLEAQYNPNRSVETHQNADTTEVRLQRNRLGHYVTAGTINNRPVTFLLDTGATGVAIGTAMANELGLKRGRRIATRTANGIAASFLTTLDTVSVGGISVQNVDATIAPGLRGEEILLGMSFLKNIEFAQRGDTLILRQYPTR